MSIRGLQESCERLFDLLREDLGWELVAAEQRLDAIGQRNLGGQVPIARDGWVQGHGERRDDQRPELQAGQGFRHCEAFGAQAAGVTPPEFENGKIVVVQQSGERRAGKRS